MKILAIRGKNLASLAGEFALDFQSEPLASAGLYAITGRTGSGKSTLLDALCLALYEQTPRLSGIASSATITDVGSNAITAGDVRTILRRGCSDGYAEVDFIGGNSIAYRARWSVRRAHGKANGKLQQTEIRLERISDGQALGDTRKTETLRLIESYVGLSFAQFTRAVLLAQNDFTAFLKASDDARAELLQTLTGTESYAKISMLAYARMKVEQEKLAVLESQQQALAPPTAEQSAQTVARMQSQADQLEAFEQQKSAIEAHLHGYQRGDELQQEEANARQILATALAAKNAAAARAEHLALLDKLQSARELCSETVRLEHAQADAAQAHDLAQNALLQAKTAFDDSALKRVDAQQRDQNASAARALAQAELDAAKAWDARISTLTPQVQAAQLECSTAAQQLQIELSQQAQALACLAADQATLAAASQWLQRNEELRPLADAWQRWELLLAQAQKILAQQSQADSRSTQCNQEIAALELDYSRASATQTQALQQLTLAQAQLRQLSADCAALDSEQLAQEQAQLELSHEHLQTALNLSRKSAELHSQQQQQRQLLLQHAEVLSRNADALHVDVQNLSLLACAEQIAKESLQLATLAASENAETIRASLQLDQPCPVCGALAHPYALHAPASNVLNSLQDQLSAKQKALRAAEIRIASLQESNTYTEQAIHVAQLLLTKLQLEHTQLSVEWANHPMHNELAVLPELQRMQNLAEQQNSVRLALARVREQAALYRELLKRKDAAQAQLDRDNIKLTHANEELNMLASKRNAAEQNLATAQRDSAELNLQLAATQTQLDGAFHAPNWRVEWRQNPIAFLTLKRTAVQTWAAQQAEVTALSTRIAQFQITLSACEKACRQAQDHLESRREKHAELALALQSDCQHRNTLFAGAAVVQIETALNAAVLQAKKELSAADALGLAAHAELARAQEALNQSEIRLEQGRSQLKAARLNLDAWLAQCNAEPVSAPQKLTALGLASLLKIAPEWITDERVALQELTRAVQTAQAVMEARSESRSAHEARQSAVEAAEILQQRLANLQLEYTVLSESVSGLKVEIALAAERARQRAALLVKIEAQTADARVWSQLGELIGSADGKKFRNFAQQLTLDILLSYANQHLQNLTRRYRVQRVKDSLGLLVVDQDMGDELRSVHSLSGGESFLLSLALALGLASLSSHRVQVESLFIDEGFGSLDVESLGIAMDALDNLQSQGRKVGVISHLQELTERIGVKVQVQCQAGGLSKIVIL